MFYEKRSPHLHTYCMLLMSVSLNKIQKQPHKVPTTIYLYTSVSTRAVFSQMARQFFIHATTSTYRCFLMHFMMRNARAKSPPHYLFVVCALGKLASFLLIYTYVYGICVVYTQFEERAFSRVFVCLQKIPFSR